MTVNAALRSYSSRLLGKAVMLKRLRIARFVQPIQGLTEGRRVTFICRREVCKVPIDYPPDLHLVGILQLRGKAFWGKS